MSLFKKSKKQSKEGKKRMEHMMYLAKENPEKVYDLSACELLNVPSSVFSSCKVLQKESLLLHTNFLKNLKTGGKISDLISLRILDLHDNKLSGLPDELCSLVNLQVLNLENNAIFQLPNDLGNLINLQTLNVKDNKLQGLPASIKNAKSLRTIDISGTNKVFYLTKSLGHVRTLEVLVLTDPSKMEYPPPHVAENGLSEIMKFICKDSGIEYVPPSHNLLPVLGNQSSSTKSQNMDESNEKFENSIASYEKMKEEKRKKHLELEKHLAETQMEQAMLATASLTNRAKDLENITKEQEQFDKSVKKQHELQERERKRLMASLVDAEKNASSLVEKLLKANEKARQQEALLEEMERQRMKEEEYFKVTQKDLEKLRKKEMLAAMQSILMEDEECAKRVQNYIENQKVANQRAQGSLQDDGKQVEDALNKQQQVQNKLIGQIMQEEEFQRQAFLQLQCEQDVARNRIIAQIQQVEQALIDLTTVEAKRNNYKMENEQEILRQKREELTDMLMTLLKEKDKREEMLRERLVEMEGQKENNQIDFWLVQYQRLMDSKPEALVTKETEMDISLLKLLSKAGAENHVPSFARNKVTTIRDLVELGDEDLRSIGVFELNVRKNILRLIEEEVAASKKLDNYETAPSPSPQPTDSITPPEPQVITPTTPPEGGEMDDNECVVCMENQSNTVFLPCGHVCVCHSCSTKLQKCPMCRSDIAQRIQIFRT